MRGARGLFLLVGLAIVIASTMPARAVDDTRYQATTIKGKLTDPATSQPMVGAAIRFQPIEEGLEALEVTTDASGAFIVQGLAFANYVIEITTAEGEKILGVNSLPIVEGQPVVIDMRISDRIVSTTSVENRPQRFLAIVNKKEINWSRFWKEFGLFFGAAATGGAAL